MSIAPQVSIFSSVFFGLINLFIVSCSAVLLHKLEAKRFINVASVSLLSSATGGIIRLVWCIDPFQVFGVWPLPGISTFLLTLSFPFILSSNLAVGLYWIETLQIENLKKIGSWLKKYNKTFYVLSASVIFMELVLGFLLLSTRVSLALVLFAIIIIYVIITVCILVFFCYACHLLRSFAETAGTAKLKRLSILGIIQCVCFALDSAFGLIIVSGISSTSSVEAGTVVAILLMASIHMLSTCEVLTFLPSKERKSTITSTNEAGSTL